MHWGSRNIGLVLGENNCEHQAFTIECLLQEFG